MTIKNVSKTEITNEDISQFKIKCSNLTTYNSIGYGITGPDVGIDKRIIAYFSPDSQLFMVNPEIIEVGEPIIFYEFDQFVNFHEKQKSLPKNVRKTIRYTTIKVKTDNIGVLEFSADNKKWQDLNDLFNDAGLIDAVAIQRLIDSINGISIKERKYNQTVVNKATFGRNERVMLKNPTDSSTIFLKWKDCESYLKRGYEIV